MRVEEALKHQTDLLKTMIKQMDTRFEENRQYSDKRFEELRQYSDKRFEEINKRFEENGRNNTGCMGEQAPKVLTSPDAWRASTEGADQPTIVLIR